MLEKRIQTAILTWLRKQPGVKAFKITGGMYQSAGISDIIACVRGRFVAIEVKCIGGKVSPLQARFINEVREAGGLGFVAYSLNEVKAQLEEPI